MRINMCIDMCEDMLMDMCMHVDKHAGHAGHVRGGESDCTSRDDAAIHAFSHTSTHVSYFINTGNGSTCHDMIRHTPMPIPLQMPYANVYAHASAHAYAHVLLGDGLASATRLCHGMFVPHF